MREEGRGRTVGRLDAAPLVLPQADLVDDGRREELVVVAGVRAHLRVRPRREVRDDLQGRASRKERGVSLGEREGTT